MIGIGGRTDDLEDIATGESPANSNVKEDQSGCTRGIVSSITSGPEDPAGRDPSGLKDEERSEVLTL